MKFALRKPAKSPGFAFVSIATPGVAAIGASLAVLETQNPSTLCGISLLTSEIIQALHELDPPNHPLTV
jgi:hypothetical protein